MSDQCNLKQSDNRLTNMVEPVSCEVLPHTEPQSCSFAQKNQICPQVKMFVVINRQIWMGIMKMVILISEIHTLQYSASDLTMIALLIL